MDNQKSYFPLDIVPVSLKSGQTELQVLLEQFEKSQYMSSDEITSYQFRFINRVFRHAIRTVPYYRSALRAAGFKKKSEITLENWQDVPLLPRSTVQKEREGFQSKFVPATHGKSYISKTSGSTGMPIMIYSTDIIQIMHYALNLRNFYWHDFDFEGKMAHIRVLDDSKNAEYPGISLPTWIPDMLQIKNTGPCVMLSSSTDIPRQAKFLLRHDPDYLFAYPTNIKALAEYFIEHDLHLNNLKKIRSFGEVMNSDVRNANRKAWGAETVDSYSAREVSTIAIQCPENENIYHVQAENLYVEVLNDDDMPCKPGEIGRVVLTNLHNYAMPLIRYEIGDYAEVGAPCSCGRTLPVLNKIMGRSRNMLKKPDGQKIWPHMRSSEWTEKLVLIRQFQLVQKSIDSVEVRVVAERKFLKQEEMYLIKTMQRQLGYPFKINIKYLDFIPRSEGGKFEDFMSEVV